jgi:hypothetical protein
LEDIPEESNMGFREDVIRHANIKLAALLQKMAVEGNEKIPEFDSPTTSSANGGTLIQAIEGAKEKNTTPANDLERYKVNHTDLAPQKIESSPFPTNPPMASSTQSVSPQKKQPEPKKPQEKGKGG